MMNMKDMMDLITVYDGYIEIGEALSQIVSSYEKNCLLSVMLSPDTPLYTAMTAPGKIQSLGGSLMILALALRKEQWRFWG